MILDHKKRYLQIAFNGDLGQVSEILPSIPYNERILIEAGTPLIKREGMRAVWSISFLWKGMIVADLKTADGALQEIHLARKNGAHAATVIGSAPTETLNLFVNTCKELGMISMIDMIGVDDPLRCIMKLRSQPDVAILHKGRDEESTKGKVINYRQVNRIKSKFECLISAAGGIDLKEARSAIFNGANIVVANIVSPDDPWTGISTAGDVKKIADEFLKTIE